SDDDRARVRERLLVSRPIEELRRAHRHPSGEEAAKKRRTSSSKPACMTALDVREKSGVWYRLNRWREEQIANGEHATYGDLVRQYIALNKMQRFERVPHGRYINFVADFFEADKRATRAE